MASAAEPAALTEPRFETVANERQLEQNVITALAQDRSGLLWIGVSNGLLRHDGVEFVPQRRGTAPDAKAVGQVRSLLAARDGCLWVGTESDGLLALNPETGQIREYRNDKAHPEALAAGALRALAEDRDGGLWIGTVGQGVQHLDPASGRFEQFKKDAGIPDDRIQSLLVDRRGTLWVGTWKGLARRAAGETRFTPVAQQLDGQLIWSLLEASDGRVWAGTRQGGLVELAPDGSLSREIDKAPGAGMVFSMAEAAPGRVWVGRIAGVEERNLDGELLRSFRRDPQRRASLGDDRVQVMKSDPAGGVWVASYGGGLQRHDTHNRSLGVLRNQPNGTHAGEEINARSIVELDNGEIWVGTHTEGVLIFGPDLNVLRSVPAVPGGIGDSGVTALAQARDGSIWLGVDNAAVLFHLDAKGRILDRLKAGEGGVRRLIAGRDGSIWAATQDGLYRERGGSVERINLEGGAPLRGNVNALVEAPDGALWAGAENGLYRLEPGSNALHKLEAEAGAGLSYPSIVGLLLDHTGRLWVDTAFGLHKLVSWSGNRARFERVSDALGIGGNAFGANLLEDARGRIWTQHAVYDPANNTVQILSTADGVDMGLPWFRAYLKLRDGRMLFGGSQGLLVVRPEGFERWTYEPPLVATELRIDGRPQPLALLGMSGKGLSLAPEQHGLRIGFAALDYSEPASSRYAYRLSGLDDHWTEVGSQARSVSYAALAPGDYRLQVRATNRAGQWSSHELDLPITVAPAWWQTLWARIGFVLAGFAALYGIVQLRTHVLNLRRAQLEAMVIERTAELQGMARALEEASLSDPLTGMRNRRFFTLNVEADVAQSLRRHAGPGAVAGADDADLCFFLLDLDDFKRVNDGYGHAAGDAMLRQMRGRLGSVFRESDHLVRWGGEEFLVVARATSRRHAAELAERVRTAVAGEPFKLDDGRLIEGRCSIGFAAFPLSPEHPRALDWSATLSLADAALYEAKHAGRNTWCGVIGAPGLPAAALKAGQAQPAQWLASGQLDVVCAARG